MRISDITVAQVAEYLRLDADSDPAYMPVCLEPMMKAAVEYMKSYTGMSAEEIDEHEEFYPVFMVLVQDMYDNRALYVNNANVNKVVGSVLGMHRQNLL